MIRLLISGLVAFAPIVDQNNQQFMHVGFPIAQGSDVHLAWLGYFAEDAVGDTCDRSAIQKTNAGGLTCWHLLQEASISFPDLPSQNSQPEDCTAVKSLDQGNMTSFCWFADLHAIDTKIDQMKGHDANYHYQAYMSFPYAKKETCHIAGRYDASCENYIADEYRFIYPGVSTAHIQPMADLAYFEIPMMNDAATLIIDDGKSEIEIHLSGSTVDLLVDHAPPPGGNFQSTHFKMIYGTATDHSFKFPSPSRQGSGVNLGHISTLYSCQSKFLTDLGECEDAKQTGLLVEDAQFRNYYVPVLTGQTPTSTTNFGPPICPSARYPAPTQ